MLQKKAGDVVFFRCVMISETQVVRNDERQSYSSYSRDDSKSLC